MASTDSINSDGPLIGSIDQGTSSSRFILFDPSSRPPGRVICQHQVKIQSHYPQEGWVEQDPLEYVASVRECLAKVHSQMQEKGIAADRLKGVGISTQRETTVVWDRETGLPLHNAIVWLDARTETTVEKLKERAGGEERENNIRIKCGLPISTYFSAVKLRWLLDEAPEVAEAARQGRLLFGTVDTWLIWNLTSQSAFVTDVTNASRTMLMDLKSLQWDDELLQFFGIQNRNILASICSSSEIYGQLSYEGSPWPDVPISGCLGDQQAALVGHDCYNPGMAKCTYGTGCFMLLNVGGDQEDHAIPVSANGLLTTVAFQMGPESLPCYALEGSVAIAGAGVAWLKDNLHLISKTSEVEERAREVADTAGVCFVPAFAGLFAPHWRSDARGVICGLTQKTNRSHICRAMLEAVCLQVWEVMEAMVRDAAENGNSDMNKKILLVDGAMTRNNLMMQMQVDLLQLTVVRPAMPEITALGAAKVAGRAVGVWHLGREREEQEGTGVISERDCFLPNMDEEEREKKFAAWKKAIMRSLDWTKSTITDRAYLD